MITYKTLKQKAIADGRTLGDAAAYLGVDLTSLQDANHDVPFGQKSAAERILSGAWLADLDKAERSKSADSPSAATVLAPTPAIKAGSALQTTPSETAATDGPTRDAPERATAAQAQVGNSATATATIASAVESEATADASMHDEKADAQQPRNALQAGLTTATEQPAAKAPKGKPAARGKPTVLPIRDDVPPPSVAAGAVASETASTTAGIGEQPVGTQGVGLGQAQGDRDRSSEVVTRVDAKSLPDDIGIDGGVNSPDAAEDTGLNTAGSETDPANFTASADHDAPQAVVVSQRLDYSSDPGARSEVVSRDAPVTRLDHTANAEIAAIADSIRQHLNRIHKDIFAIGRALLLAKEKLNHGEWLPWLETEFGWTPRSAQNFMNVAARLGDKCENVSHLGVATLYRLAAPSTPDEVLAAVTSMAEVGTKLTLQDVTRMLREAKPKKKRPPLPAALEGRGTEAEEAFDLLVKKLQPTELERLGYLLDRCDMAKITAMLRNHPSGAKREHAEA